MYKKKYLFTCSVLFLLLFSCRSKQIAFNPKNPDTSFISFGIGGGFTGKFINYYLTKEGNIYAVSGTEYKRMGQVQKNTCTQIFLNYFTLGLDKLTINDPGNKYYFIEYTSAEISGKLLWGKTPLENKNVDVFYAILMNLVKEINNGVNE